MEPISLVLAFTLQGNSFNAPTVPVHNQKSSSGGESTFEKYCRENLQDWGCNYGGGSQPPPTTFEK